MKKNLKVIMVSLILIFSLIIITPKKDVKADSGWDTDYDVSTKDKSFDWTSYEYSDEDSSLYIHTYVILLIVFLFIIIAATTIYDNHNNYKKHQKEIEMKLSKYIHLNYDELRDKLYQTFINIQIGWMNFDYDSLRKNCDNNLFNEYREELEALKLKDGQNIMSDFKLLSFYINSIELENELIIVDCNLGVAFYDYVINNKSKEIIKGNKNKKIINYYNLKFTMSNLKTIDKCPNCGSKIGSGTTKCNHCKAIIVQDSNEFVMTEKKIID